MKTADELQIDCEIAADVIAEYVAFWAKRLAEEKHESSPNLEKVEALETQIRELKREKMSLGADNPPLVNKALYVYTEVLKKTRNTANYGVAPD